MSAKALNLLEAAGRLVDQLGSEFSEAAETANDAAALIEEAVGELEGLPA